MREIELIGVVTPDRMARSPAEAIAFIETFDESHPDTPFTRYEIGVR